MILRFENYIKENYSPMGSFGQTEIDAIGSMGTVPAKDPSLSYNPNNQYNNDVKTRLHRAGELFKRINFTAINPYIEDFEHSFEELTVMRLDNKFNTADVYIKFIYDDMQYYGYIKNINRSDFEFSSTIFTIPEFYYNNVKCMRLKNMLFKTVLNWMIPDRLKYRLLKEIELKNSLGQLEILHKGSLIDVVFVSMSDIFKPYAIIEKDNKQYKIDSNNLYSFRWYFKQDEKRVFYI